MLLFFKYGQPEMQSFLSDKYPTHVPASWRTAALSAGEHGNIRNSLTKGLVLILVCGMLLGNGYISSLLNLF